MLNVSIALRLILSLAVVVAITLLLWYEKAVAHQSGILIFFYLIPNRFCGSSFWQHSGDCRDCRGDRVCSHASV
jgi:hypothetical protein